MTLYKIVTYSYVKLLKGLGYLEILNACKNRHFLNPYCKLLFN